MIIELGKYNDVRELLIGINTTGLLRHVCYLDTDQEGVGNYGGCLHEEDRDGSMIMTQGCIKWGTN